MYMRGETNMIALFCIHRLLSSAHCLCCACVALMQDWTVGIDIEMREFLMRLVFEANALRARHIRIDTGVLRHQV